MATTGSKEETFKLIEIWGDDAVQAQLEGCRRNQEVFTKVAAALAEAGYHKTVQQCREKVKKLKLEYRRNKDKRRKTGEGRYPEWDYFDAIDAILGHKPATQPPVVVNSQSTSDEQEQMSQEELSAIPESPPTGSQQDQPGISGDTERSRSATPVLPQVGKKRKRSNKAESFTGELLQTFIDAQQKSDQLLIPLEEKRLKLEETQMKRGPAAP